MHILELVYFVQHDVQLVIQPHQGVRHDGQCLASSALQTRWGVKGVKACVGVLRCTHGLVWVEKQQDHVCALSIPAHDAWEVVSPVTGGGVGGDGFVVVTALSPPTCADGGVNHAGGVHKHDVVERQASAHLEVHMVDEGGAK